jgi:hypothetical protein
MIWIINDIVINFNMFPIFVNVVLRSRHGWSGWSLSKEARLRLAMEGVENEGLRQNYH